MSYAATVLRIAPAEGANGFRLSGFACGRDDLRGRAAGMTSEEEQPG